jgi:hypothetical protein
MASGPNLSSSAPEIENRGNPAVVHNVYRAYQKNEAGKLKAGRLCLSMVDCSFGSDPIDARELILDRKQFSYNEKSFARIEREDPRNRRETEGGHSSRATTLYPVKYKGLFGYDGRHVYSVAHGPVW